MENVWVDFKAVKAAVTMEMVLGHYNVNWLKRKDDELRGRCPIHKGEGQNTFHASIAKNNFQCFSCKKKGNVLDFAAAMEQCSVRDAAVKLAEWFSVAGSDEQSVTQTAPTPAAAESGGEGTPAENKPLTFQLKGVHSNHPYLGGRGLDRKTAELFGVGFFPGKGSMSGRVVIPIHNERGELVAYAGRAIDGSEPKYKLPVGFHKSLELYNLHRAVVDNEPRLVVVVEGFFDCMHVYWAGFPCVALMGCSMSDRQCDLLTKYFRAAILLLDGDDAGWTASVEMVPRLASAMFVKVVRMSFGKQPDMLSADELRELLLGGGR